jgi:hypothetical protein
LAARRTRTRVIGGYDSTREGAKGLSAYLFYITHFVCNGGGGGNQLREILGEDQEVLDPHELQKPIPGLWEGLVGLVGFVRSFSHWKILSFMFPILELLLVTSHIHSPILFIVHPLSWSLHSCPSLHSLIFPHFGVLAWERKMNC